ncbi:HNH endonuclease [Nocardia fluminea]|uniref:HNH endonuclease n=2 Tax=Nocardia fluminea TaxID=134984 RepID=UPI003401BFE7
MPTGGSKQVRAARKRKKRMAAVTHDLTDAQWDALKTSWGGCAYCRSPASSLQKDCIQAISRGGRYTLGNVVPACGSCNASKCNAEVTGWLRRKKLDERSFLVRHYEIATELTTRFA